MSFQAAIKMIDLATEAMEKPSLLAELGLYELNNLQTKLDIVFTLEADQPKFIEFCGFVSDTCPDCGIFHDVHVSIFRNEGEMWGAMINGSREIGDREFATVSEAFRHVESELQMRGFHQGCAA